jgi:hypothetical protein
MAMKKLYSAESRKEFEGRYGKTRGDEVWRETLGVVAREQASHKPGHVKLEEVKPYTRYTDEGEPVHVAAHTARIHSHSHSQGHHGGPCSTNCRHGRTPHRHRS